jgi:4-amino-4-deoxy-L-arabinose transferase-like glycosyltransferase
MAALVLLRLPAILHPRAIDDEQVYSVVASVMAHGGKPYLDAVERKPPLLFGLYATVFRLAGEYNWTALHLTAVGWTFATMVLLYLITRRLFDPTAATFAAMLYGLFQAWADYRNLAFNGELLMNLPIVAAVGLTLGPHRWRWRPELAAAGALIGIAFLLKQPAGIAGLPLGWYVLGREYRRSRGFSWGDSLRHAALLVVGLLASFGVTALLLRREGILNDAIHWTVLDHMSPVGPTYLHFWQRALFPTAVFVGSTLPLVLAAASSVWQGIDPAGTLWSGRRGELVALLILLAVSVVGLSASGQFLYHYYLQLLPPLALLAAPVCGAIWRGGEAPPPQLLPGRTWLTSWLALTAAVYLMVDTIGIRRHREDTDVGRWVREHSAAGDRLFVWGQGDRQVGVYLDARRQPASRYIAIFPLTGHVFGGYPESWGAGYEDTRVLPGAWDNLRADFERHPPRFIIDGEVADPESHYPVSRYPQLSSYLTKWYREAYRGRDGVVYVRDGR